MNGTFFLVVSSAVWCRVVWFVRCCGAVLRCVVYYSPYWLCMLPVAARSTAPLLRLQMDAEITRMCGVQLRYLEARKSLNRQHKKAQNTVGDQGYLQGQGSGSADPVAHVLCMSCSPPISPPVRCSPPPGPPVHIQSWESHFLVSPWM